VRRAISALVGFLIMAAPAAGQTVVDGDTLKLNGTTYRLWGMDAPETQQLCTDGWPAGRAALSFLRDLTRDKTVVCVAKTTDRYGRSVAICHADGVDLSASMVAAGMALAFVRYSSDYVQQEAAARAARLGVHAHDCAAAWEWRAKQRSTE
jgi:endonuclease YncB( thermonuclease family)